MTQILLCVVSRLRTCFVITYIVNSEKTTASIIGKIKHVNPVALLFILFSTKEIIPPRNAQIPTDALPPKIQYKATPHINYPIINAADP